MTDDSTMGGPDLTSETTQTDQPSAAVSPKCRVDSSAIASSEAAPRPSSPFRTALRSSRRRVATMWVAGANASSEGRYPGTGRQNSSWARTGFATAHIVEAQDQEAAAGQLGTLPLVQHEVTSFRLTPLAPGVG